MRSHVSKFRKLRAYAATYLALGVAAGTTVLFLLERFVAEVDDDERETDPLPGMPQRRREMDPTENRW